MIDLRNKGLPQTLDYDGKSYPIETDFRTWIAFDHALEAEGVALFDIFKGERPPLDDVGWVDAAREFLESPNATPRSLGRASTDRTIDMVLDGDYIVASFQSAYGIDLTDPDLKMHWHRFKALLGGLPDASKMASIIGYRSWRKDSRKHDTVMAELKRAWELPRRGAEREMDEARKIAEMWYEQQNGGANG